MQASLFLFGAVFLVMILLGIRLYMLEKKMRTLFSNGPARPFESLVHEHAELIGDLQRETKDHASALDSLDRRFLSSVQKIGMVRFNPFSNTGGDQSFAIALLDGNDNGFVLSGLYLHGQAMVYAKPIEEGKERYTLSDEERQALGKATSRV